MIFAVIECLFELKAENKNANHSKHKNRLDLKLNNNKIGEAE